MRGGLAGILFYMGNSRDRVFAPTSKRCGLQVHFWAASIQSP